MKVSELIEQLQAMPQDAEIWVCADGRYAHSMLDVWADEEDGAVIFGERD